MKLLVNLLRICIVCSTPIAFGQKTVIGEFSKKQQQFAGSKLEQAEFLLREVRPMGIVNEEKREIPFYLTRILRDSVVLPIAVDINHYLTKHGISATDLGGALTNAICTNANGKKATYFVIHDTSTPNYESQEIPDHINEESWEHNNVHKIWANRKKAHVFVGRTGKSYSPVSFDTPWRATKLELKKIPADISKGLFIHIELVQPRKSDPEKWAGNDVLSPIPGFTPEQYERLALLYLCASSRKGEWLVPAFHACIDHGIKDAHDDPQNFDLKAFNNALAILINDVNQDHRTPSIEFDMNPLTLWSTFYRLPSYSHDPDGISLLDSMGNEMGFSLSSCDWCDAAIQGTVVIFKGWEASTFNYAGRSETLLYDCRKCKRYANFKGYEATGKVLWTASSGFGRGVKNYNLVPFRTVAVDPKIIPYGSVLFIAKAVGTRYTAPDGSLKKHDGYFFAGDTGSAIIGNHIDVFIGENKTNPFNFVKSIPSRTFEAYIITDLEKIESLKLLHIE